MDSRSTSDRQTGQTTGQGLVGDARQVPGGPYRTVRGDGPAETVRYQVLQQHLKTRPTTGRVTDPGDPIQRQVERISRVSLTVKGE